MHRQQRKIILRSHHTAGSSIFGDQLQAGNGGVGPDQVEAHQPGQNHSEKHRNQSETVILLADDLVVDTKDPLADKAGRGRVLMNDWG